MEKTRYQLDFLLFKSDRVLKINLIKSDCKMLFWGYQEQLEKTLNFYAC